MGKQRIQNWKQCRDVRDVEQFAREHGAVDAGQEGSHHKWRNPSNGEYFETVHHGKEQSDFVARSNFNTLKRWGWIVLVVACLLGGVYVAFTLGLC